MIISISKKDNMYWNKKYSKETRERKIVTVWGEEDFKRNIEKDRQQLKENSIHGMKKNVQRKLKNMPAV